MVETRFGSTHILTAGPASGRPIVALQGGNVVNPLTLAWLGRLVGEFRIYAPDTIGQPGKSSGRRVSANDASLGEWAVDVLDGGRPGVRVLHRRVVWRGRLPPARGAGAGSDRSSASFVAVRIIEGVSRAAAVREARPISACVTSGFT